MFGYYLSMHSINRSLVSIVDIDALPGGLVTELTSLQVVPYIFHLTSSVRHLPSSIRHRFYACAYGKLHAADGAFRQLLFYFNSLLKALNCDKYTKKMYAPKISCFFLLLSNQDSD